MKSSRDVHASMEWGKSLKRFCRKEMHFLAITAALPLFLISSAASLPFFDLPAESPAEGL